MRTWNRKLVGEVQDAFVQIDLEKGTIKELLETKKSLELEIEVWSQRVREEVDAKLAVEENIKKISYKIQQIQT